MIKPTGKSLFIRPLLRKVVNIKPNLKYYFKGQSRLGIFGQYEKWPKEPRELPTGDIYKPSERIKVKSDDVCPSFFHEVAYCTYDYPLEF